MKRTFGDLLGILSSILLGVLVRDFDDLCGNLRSLFELRSWHVSTELVAWLTGVVLIGVFLRNIHGSVCFEDFLQRSKVKPQLYSTHGSRAFALGLSLASLFGGPALAGHYILHHVNLNVLPPIMPSAPGGTAFTVSLFMSFAVYFIWDVFLWVFGTDGDGDEEFDRIVRRWVVIDAGALTFFLMVGFADLYRFGKGLPFNYEIAALSFTVISFVVLLADYTTNKALYFASSPETVI